MVSRPLQRCVAIPCIDGFSLGDWKPLHSYVVLLLTMGVIVSSVLWVMWIWGDIFGDIRDSLRDSRKRKRPGVGQQPSGTESDGPDDERAVGESESHASEGHT